jgi:CRP/FNR family transcriptional regulator, nitrogen oxide reductase regulator
VDDCLLLSWPNRLWQVFASTLEGVSRESMLAFAARTEEMSTRIVELSTKSMEQRIACALLRLVGQSGKAVKGGIEIGFPISRQNIADMTGSTLHSVSRVLSAWERQGMIDGARCRIVVTDPQRMGMISTGASRPAVRRAAEPCEGVAVR